MANRLRHYEALPRYLDGFLVLGDAVHILNPVLAEGITLAAADSLVLDRALHEQASGRMGSNLTGLSKAFQQALRESLDSSWRKVISIDRRWPDIEVTAAALPARQAGSGDKIPHGQCLITVRSI